MIKKFLGLLFISTILWSCGSQFNQSKYGRYMWNRSSGKNQVEKNDVVKNDESSSSIQSEENLNVGVALTTVQNEDANSIVSKNLEINEQTKTSFKSNHSKNKLSAYSNTSKTKLPVINKLANKINKKSKKQNPYNDADVDAMWVVTLILCFLIPPLGVYLKDGSITGLFWLVLILCLVGGSILFGLVGYFGGLYGVGIILALLRFFDII